jgi:cellulose biosynthesis protein BcsQ
MKAKLNRVIERFAEILTGNDAETNQTKCTRYAVTNFRGGIGKSTLAFNLAYEITRGSSGLFLDLCSQRNLSQALLGDDLNEQTDTVYDALLAKVANATPVDIDDILVSVKPHCSAFKGGKEAYLIPGSSELFLFPSVLYGQLATLATLQQGRAREPSARILRAIDSVITEAFSNRNFQKVLIDTSPFFGGATHLAWEAAEALVIPARVDQNSMDALRLTLSMLRDHDRDFVRFNNQAGIIHSPKVHAIAITHCGWSRQKQNTPDNATKYFIQEAINIVNEFEDCFSHNDLSDCIHILDDFHSAGRISGTRRIPLSKLEAGQQYTVEGQRLEVNPAVNRYKKEIHALAAVF